MGDAEGFCARALRMNGEMGCAGPGETADDEEKSFVPKVSFPVLYQLTGKGGVDLVRAVCGVFGVGK